MEPSRLLDVIVSSRRHNVVQPPASKRVGPAGHTGTFDATWRYFYNGQKIVETHDGSGNIVQQFIHGMQYIDELIQVRVKDKGDHYVHQDANWNVIALTDLGGTVVERYVYTPYGEVTVHQDTGYGDRDGDGDVDSTDKGTVGSTCTGTVSGACRILDLDFDGDYDSSDATKFDALTQGSLRTPGLKSSAVSQPFAHQGLLFEPEIGSYQNRARQHLVLLKRFAQPDPLLRRLASSQSTGIPCFIMAPTPFDPPPDDDQYNPLISDEEASTPSRPLPEPAYEPPPDVNQPGNANPYHYLTQNPLGRLDPLGLRVCGRIKCKCGSPTVKVKVYEGLVAPLIGAFTTYCSVISSPVPCEDLCFGAYSTTLAHECGHVCQCRSLGARGFYAALVPENIQYGIGGNGPWESNATANGVQNGWATQNYCMTQ